MSKNPILERAKNHFDERVPTVIEVPEWGETPENPLLIYCRPFNLSQKNQLFKKSGSSGTLGTFDLSVMVECLIMKSEDVEEKKLFTLEDKRQLMTSVDPDVVSRIAMQMLKDVDVEELSGNLEGTLS